jgi:hypothetical protein
MRKNLLFATLFLSFSTTFAQKPDSLPPPKEKDGLKYSLNESGSHYFQVTFLNQVWVRSNQSNPGTQVQQENRDNTFDIGLRRTRIQMFGQITDRVFLYLQFGQNNFNAFYNYTDAGGLNRKNAPFFHDAVGEYRVSKHGELKIGGGMTIVNGLSRFSQPSVGTIMTLDVPVFAQATVDQTDEFSRKLSIYAKGQIGKHIDYRLVVSDPFPIQSNGNPPPALNTNATFALKGHHQQFQGYLVWQFFEQEPHATPGYETGTYLGKRKIFNIAAGAITQAKAMWYKETTATPDSLAKFQDMTLLCIESFLDMPLNKERGTAVSAYAGFFNLDYGRNYLRYNGIMNPGTGLAKNSTSYPSGSQGNAFPMFGSGQVFYTQVGYLLPRSLLGEKGGQLLPYASWMHGNYDRLGGKQMDVIRGGMNWLIKGHSSKLTLDYENRPTFTLDAQGQFQTGTRRGCLTLQYQIFI